MTGATSSQSVVSSLRVLRCRPGQGAVRVPGAYASRLREVAGLHVGKPIRQPDSCASVRRESAPPPTIRSDRQEAGCGDIGSLSPLESSLSIASRAARRQGDPAQKLQ